jgi:RHS repeat-associated protein
VSVREANGTTYFVHADWLGTERARSGMNGGLCGSATSQPFGDNATSGGCFTFSPNFFTGKESDPETGLHYFHARFDNNRFYRFQTPDPHNAGANLADPQTWNMYAYVRNNPTTLIDPSGLNPAEPTGGSNGSLYREAGDTLYFFETPEGEEAEEESLSQEKAQNDNPPQQQPAQNQADAQKPPQPAPTDPQTGKPTPPPVPVPGAPEGTGWKWNPDPQNPRGGTWGPDNWKGPNPPRGSWDPDGHWDVDRGGKGPRDHYDPQGNPITPGQAHPGNAPTTQTMMDRMRSITPGPILKWGTAGVVLYIIIDEGSRLYPPRNLVPVP